jgi:hypothetical protein
MIIECLYSGNIRDVETFMVGYFSKFNWFTNTFL